MTETSVFPSTNSEEGSLLLSVSVGLIKIPDWLKLKADSLNYRAKDEYHITVVGRDLAQKIQGLSKRDKISSLFANTHWTVEATDTYIELAKDDENGIHRQSVICLASVPQLEQFYRELEDTLGITISLPPTHITLYTKTTIEELGYIAQMT